MIRWLYVPVLGALLLLGACADGNFGQPQLSQAAVAKQVSLDACKSAAFVQTPLPRGESELGTLGEPMGRGAYWYEGTDRQIDDCLAARTKAPAS
jgi:hypothetical protein